MRSLHGHPGAERLLILNNTTDYGRPFLTRNTPSTSGASHLGTILAPIVTNPLQFDRVCKEVLRFSLLQRYADAPTFTVPGLALKQSTCPQI